MADDVDNASDIQEMQRDIALTNRVCYISVSAKTCVECDDIIPQGRRDAVPGCKLCIE